ncbi:type II secretion system protein [Metasolibacillus sp.]|uniref:type II secretion system protein n=1 Tax=Metasolibacillus sp. TaxID=2703680 RepID=UPI0025EA26A1|nr:type II secretion system protein [Metasolibacillus sp.]MCT6922644.1 type II secretion system GspH family protein [Metasolibacillus sp.]MCT6939017.1 type II secretion system GspH family protein [Metasolibacillus sp.]
MQNSNGFSLVDTLVGLVIIFFLAGTLLPLSSHLQSSLYNQKLELHASEVALNGARAVQLYHLTSGEMTIQNVTYDWHYTDGEICVDFHNTKEKRQKCIGF